MAKSLLHYLTSALSVRSRVALLAAIPIVGFGVIGATYLSGEHAIQTAFDDTRISAALAEMSGNLKSELGNMREAAKDFALSPLQTPRDHFEAAFKAALAAAAGIGRRDRSEGTARDLAQVKAEIQATKKEFDHLVEVRGRMGFNIATGAQGDMYAASSQLYRLVEQLPSDLKTRDALRLTALIQTMRLFEKDFLLTGHRDSAEKLLDEHRKLSVQIDYLPIGSAEQSKLHDALEDYRKAFDTLSEAAGPATLYLTLITQNLQNLMPAADKIVEIAAQRQSIATRTLAASQSRTRTIIAMVGVAAVGVALLFCWLIGRSITIPLDGLAGAMSRLAGGDTASDIPATYEKNEIGAMARTVIVFRDNMLERERLASTQTQSNRARELRGEIIAATIARFEKSVDHVLDKVRGAATDLESTSGQLNAAADDMLAEARTAEHRVTESSANVTNAAGSVEELAASIGEIAAQAAKSTEVAQRAVSEARRTTQTMIQLGDAASRIGEVISLIQAIAGQTNLLALNATIEAARAGDAGRGFAVVASEVKSLAGQTAKATEEIAGQIGAIQNAATDAARAITQVNAIIEDMSAIAANVAVTVEEQSAAVSSIAQGVSSASAEAQTGAEAMSRVASATTDARGTATDVKALADTLAIEAESLEIEVRRFLSDVQAA